MIPFLSMFSLSLNSRLLSVREDDLREADRQGLRKGAYDVMVDGLEQFHVAYVDIHMEEIA